MNQCEPFKGLLIGLLDGELTPEEARQINDHLIRCAACRNEYDSLRETSGKLAGISFLEPDDAVLAQVWHSPFSRLSRNASLVMIIGGCAVLLGYVVFEFLTSGTMGLPAKTGDRSNCAGFFDPLGSVDPRTNPNLQDRPLRGD
jgi:predicted anti-sigma-YlaC factor YlaD